MKQLVGLRDKIAPDWLELPFEVIHSAVLLNNTPSLHVPIPGEYKHLVIMGSGRVVGGGTAAQYILMQYNHDTGDNYHQQKLDASDTDIVGELNTSQVGAIAGMAIEDGSFANLPAGFMTIIPHYGSSFYKTSLAFSHYHGTVNYAGSTWVNTAKISSLTFVPVTDEFAAGFAFSVYGVR
jgi:hypothetical protein